VFGTEDPHTGEPERRAIGEQLAAAGIDARVDSYEAQHAFMRDVGPRYDPQAADAAFLRGIAFFDAAFEAGV